MELDNLVDEDIDWDDLDVDIKRDEDYEDDLDDAEDTVKIEDDDLLSLPQEEVNELEATLFPGSLDEDAEVEIVVKDEDFDISAQDSDKKSAFYEALKIRPSAKQMPADAMLDMVQRSYEIKPQVIAFARAHD